MTGRPSLLLAGHGFPRQPKARHPAQDHAERLGESGPFEDVSAGLLHGSPELTERLQRLHGEAVVVPLFVSNGYFAGEVIPDLIDTHCPDSASITYTPPVGTHDRVTDVIHRRASRALDGEPATGELALLGHGATRQSANREVIESHARRLRERGAFDVVQSYFLEEEPRIETLRREAHADEVVAVPVFVAEGHHASEEIPELLAIGSDGSDGVSITYTDPVGTSPEMADVAFRRAVAALDGEATAAPGTPPAGSNPLGGETS